MSQQTRIINLVLRTKKKCTIEVFYFLVNFLGIREVIHWQSEKMKLARYQERSCEIDMESYLSPFMMKALDPFPFLSRHGGIPFAMMALSWSVLPSPQSSVL